VTSPVDAPPRARRLGRDRGAVTTFVALTLPVLILMTAFAVDLGRQRSSRRTMQARSDIIALDLVRLADGRTEDQIMAGAQAEMVASAQRNGIEPAKVDFEYGTWSKASGFIGTLGTAVPNAVRVTSAETIDYYFRPGEGATSRTAIARTDAKAGFSIGSFAAAVDSGNSALLNLLIGDALGLGVLSYSGLATADLDWLGIATQMGFGTPEELFTSGVDAYEVVSAGAEILRRDSANAAQVAVLDQVLAVSDSPLRDVSVLDVITVDAGGEAAAATAGVNLLDFLTTAAFIANGSSGVSVPAVNLGFPGASVTGSLNLIQQPQTVFGGVGASTGTSQAGVTATSTIGTTTIGNRVVSTLESIVPGICGLLLLGPLLCGLTSRLITIDLNATLTVNLATADGTIARIGCGSPQELDVDVRSDLVSTSLVLNAVIKANGSTVGTVPLSVSSGGGAFNGAADFVLPPDQFDVFYPVNPASGAIGLETASIQGLGALGTLLTPALNTLINATVTQVNANIVQPLGELMGVRVASADVAPRAVDCNLAQLVG
jgi:uncharacterized membrane protein